MSTSTLNYIQEVTNHAKQLGGEYVGSVVNLNVRLFHQKLLLNDIRAAIINNPNIPNEWAPDPLNKLSTYLHTATELNRSSIRKFDLPQDEDFDVDEFGGYHVKRLQLKKDDSVPCSHRVFFTRKTTNTVDDKVIEDIEIESSIVVHLRRTYGWTDEDENGTSEFQINVDTTDCLPGDFVYFKPFLATLKNLFDERTKGTYEASQVRELFLNVLKKDIGVESLNDGLYFVKKKDVEPVANLAHSLNRLDPGINVINIPVTKFPEQAFESFANETFSQVSQGVTRSLVKDVQDLLQELEEFEESESKTRESTWFSRREMLLDIKNKYEEYKQEEMILGDSIENLIKQCSKKIVTNLS